MLDAIFERFRQVTETDRRGLGLGLYISKCLVQAQGGTIWAESRIDVGDDDSHDASRLTLSPQRLSVQPASPPSRPSSPRTV